MIDVLINASRIKYEILSTLFEEVVIDDHTVNLYVDLHSVIYRLYMSRNNPIVVNDRNAVKSMVVSILNSVGHYRRFLATRLKKNNRIFIVFNRKIPDYQSKQIEYGRKYYDRYSYANQEHCSINNSMDAVVGYLKDLCQFFEDIFFIDCEAVEEMDAIGYLIGKYDGFNVVYTNNELNYQLVENNDTIILYPSRDKSKIITRDTLFDFILADNKYRPTIADYRIYPIYLTLAGLSKRDVPSLTVKGKVKTIKLLEMMIAGGLISNDVSVSQFIKILTTITELSKDEQDHLSSRYRAICARLGQVALGEGKKKRIEAGLVNLYDQNNLDELNDSLGGEFSLAIQDLNKNKHAGKRVIW